MLPFVHMPVPDELALGPDGVDGDDPLLGRHGTEGDDSLFGTDGAEGDDPLLGPRWEKPQRIKWEIGCMQCGGKIRDYLLRNC